MNMDLSALNLPTNPVIVDCGCNEGQWLSHVLPQLKGQPRVIAIDMLRPEAERCQAKHPQVLVINVALAQYTGFVAYHRYECSQCSSILNGTEALDKLCGHKHESLATVTARRHECSQSSSILKMTELHNKVWGSPTHEPVAEEQVRAMTLDDLLALTMIDHVDLLKLDLQGYELHALCGAEETLKRTSHVISEVEWVKLYEGQVLYPELKLWLYDRGFYDWGFFDMRYLEDGSPACGDAVWTHKDCK
jgi:FkbM family methyltransferase